MPVGRGDPLGAMLGSVALLALLARRRRARGKSDYWLLVLIALIGVSAGLAACQGPEPGPGPTEPPTEPPQPGDTPSPEPPPTASGKTAYLTFDDGPDPVGNSVEIAAVLNSNGSRATFFLTGADRDSFVRLDLPCANVDTTADPNLSNIDPNMLQITLIANMGHAIGIHGWYHESWNTSGFNVEEQITREVNELTNRGVTPDPLLRAPGGDWPSVPIDGYESWYYYHWSINSCDNYRGESDVPVCPNEVGPILGRASGVVGNVMHQLQGEGYPDRPIILLHSTNPSTWQSIVHPANDSEDLLLQLRNAGYTNFAALPRPGDPTGTVIRS